MSTVRTPIKGRDLTAQDINEIFPGIVNFIRDGNEFRCEINELFVSDLLNLFSMTLDKKGASRDSCKYNLLRRVVDEQSDSQLALAMAKIITNLPA